MTPARDSSSETFSDAGFTSELVATLSPYSLVGLAWAPDGRLFVWQKNGVVRVIKQGVLLQDTKLFGLLHVDTLDCDTFHFVGLLQVAMRPNPSIERTSSSKLRLLPAAAHVER